MAGGDDAYLSYLVRLWREDRDGDTAWLASLESAETRERTYFASLDELVLYLRERTAESPGKEMEQTQRDRNRHWSSLEACLLSVQCAAMADHAVFKFQQGGYNE